MGAPASTYRLQVRASFDLDAAADVTGYLRDLGADWAYLSPILQSAGGSDHGYDVVDPTRVDEARGGAAGLDRFAAAARAAALGVLVDIVPNHQGVAVPAENPWWWDVLAYGEQSAHAASFDIDWAHGGGRLRLPVLGAELDDVIAAGELTVAPESPDSPHAPDAPAAPFGTARYYDLVLPLAPGTAPLHETTDAAAVRDVLARQHWELGFWRRAEDLLNYRRFFTVTSLAGVRVERPDVFDASHVEVVRWVRDGLVDGLRIDHPDGLADPGGYLDRLSDATGGVYTVVEKILEPGEELPGWWAAEGTTGYDALGEIERVLVDPAGERPLTDAAPQGPGWDELIARTKRDVADTSQAAEVGRLVRCLPAEARETLGDAVARDALAELLTRFDVYRAYLPAGADRLARAAAEASAHRPDLAEAVARLVPLIADADAELSHRFMQTTGPVMAKGVEDRAFYRFTRLGSLTEVGGDPSRFSLTVPQLHDAFARRQASWPHALTALTTHDTKRSEDTRARLDVLAEIPERWAAARGELSAIASTGDGALDDLLWQAVVGVWSDDPDLGDRLHAYAEKAARESGAGTSWEDPDEAFEAGVHALVDAAAGAARPVVERVVDEIAGAGRSNGLSAKLLQLAGPGVPDVYQGTELWDHSLVDPDNRRAVDYDARRTLLARIDDGWHPPVDASGAAKLLLVSRTLRLRRDRPELFTRYTPLETAGAARDHAVAFDRGGAIAIATRLPLGLAARGGWTDAAVMLPAGPWRDELTGRLVSGGAAPLAQVLADYPVALLTRAG
ncbi:malto-oligosyltrehalose synthase [Microbacterium dextranolyticum]|uniref:malto-oligosyltrehalose synthase n=1 Tax=Microbacterium dextranolyticum TaxID=36806 RepID=UPI0019588907|nr:malto-oligosyltrehalose synthase [Microbacterium dextranolyticum]MBM7461970.1 (1->4)-alpha-D-glucan 1-alpha-D-glucosylmutase [Microbacterium dextranolyticum]